MTSWLKRCPAWQFSLVWSGLVFVGIMVAGSGVQWMWRGHLDFSALLGSAGGGTLASLIVGAGWRAARSDAP